MTKLTALPPPKQVQAPKPPKPVAAVKQVKQPPVPPSPSPMARPPVHKTQRVVPKVDTPRGVVRTDTHNVANNHVPAKAKHGKRGFKGA